MTGYATVAIPLAGRLDAGASYAWLITNALACALFGTALAARAIPGALPQAIAFAGIALIGLWYLPRVDGGLPALLILLGAAWFVARRLPREAPRPTTRG